MLVTLRIYCVYGDTYIEVHRYIHQTHQSVKKRQAKNNRDLDHAINNVFRSDFHKER